ncbi:MAG: hypothetical protein NTY19_32630 [Planctomycetota bacterium]|nr:hypothetical protein [Planctomycetota bacterium]
MAPAEPLTLLAREGAAPDEPIKPLAWEGEAPAESLKPHGSAGTSPSRVGTVANTGTGGIAPVVPPKPATAPDDEDFGFECHVCKTRLYARPRQVGKHVVCPDCYTQVLVPPPKPHARKPRATAGQDADFKLSELDKLPPDLATGLPASAASSQPHNQAASKGQPSVSDSRPRGNVLTENARAILAKAEAELKELEESQPQPPPEWPSVTVFLSFLWEPGAAIRWIILTLVGYAVVALSYGVAALSSGGPIAQFEAMALGVVLLTLVIVWVLTSSICCLAVVQDTANGYDKIEHWPGIGITEWVLDAFFVLASSFAAFMPAAFLASISPWLSLPAWLAGLAVFPFFLLSTLETGSRVMIYSPLIWRTWRMARPLWRRFFLQSSGVILVALGALACLAWGGFIFRALGSASLIASLFVYFRLLGTLARKLAELPPPDETEPEGE